MDAPKARYSTGSDSDLVTRDIYQVAIAPCTVPRLQRIHRNNSMDLAATMGIELLTEKQYWELQTLENFDTKTSSWVKTPADFRKLGGAIFYDRHYRKVFVYHNGAESYYAARAFRGSLRGLTAQRTTSLREGD